MVRSDFKIVDFLRDDTHIGGTPTWPETGRILKIIKEQKEKKNNPGKVSVVKAKIIMKY